MKISVGDYILVASATVIQFGDNPIKVTLPDEIEGDFNFHIKFRSSTEHNNAVTTINQIDQFNLQIDFINCDNVANAGNPEYLRIGTLRHTPLYLSYRVNDLQGSGKTIILNFFTKPEVQNFN